MSEEEVLTGVTSGWLLVALGLFLLAGYLAHVVGRRAHVPRVTLLLLLGVAVGPHGLHLVPEAISDWFSVVAQLALSVVGFMLGERFLGRNLRESGRLVFAVSIGESLGAALVVLLGLIAIGASPVFAMLLAGIAVASAPAATVDVIREIDARGRMTDTVLGVVAIDDAYAIMSFTVLVVIAQALAGDGLSGPILLEGAWELVGAIALGVFIGAPMAWVTGRVRPGELTLLEALGFVLLCGGIASLIGVSYLLACIVLGAVVANRATHHTRPFHAIEGVSQPFLVVFFVLAGFQLDPSMFASVGLLGSGYLLFRIIGKVIGAYAGARLVRAPHVFAKHVGWCLLPQAGVALGLGLLAAERFPAIGSMILSLLVGTTFLFELVGPVATRVSLVRVGEASREPSTPDSG
jgi:Kef-type K+ transport system membrane component KefB